MVLMKQSNVSIVVVTFSGIDVRDAPLLLRAKLCFGPSWCASRKRRPLIVYLMAFKRGICTGRGAARIWILVSEFLTLRMTLRATSRISLPCGNGIGNLVTSTPAAMHTAEKAFSPTKLRRKEMRAMLINKTSQRPFQHHVKPATVLLLPMIPGMSDVYMIDTLVHL